VWTGTCQHTASSRTSEVVLYNQPVQLNQPKQYICLGIERQLHRNLFNTVKLHIQPDASCEHLYNRLCKSFWIFIICNRPLFILLGHSRHFNMEKRYDDVITLVAAAAAVIILSRNLKTEGEGSCPYHPFAYHRPSKNIIIHRSTVCTLDNFDNVTRPPGSRQYFFY